MKIFMECQGESMEIDVGDNGLIIGRESRDIPVQDRLCSKEHALIFETLDGRLCIFDLDSRNGTFVDDKSVSCAQLKAGCEVKVGKTKFKILSIENERTQVSIVQRGWPAAWNCVSRKNQEEGA